jgi:hypothetical protein
MMLLQENNQPMENHACSEGYQSICLNSNGQVADTLNQGCNALIQEPLKMKEFQQKLRGILDKK